ncbi:MAG TPA: hypothetical protein VGF56_11375 [Rhizomicrobium sp.]|jgi:hypothetical protein
MDPKPLFTRRVADMLIGGVALFVSLVSLWVAIRTENANEQLVAASTWPFLQVQLNNSTPEGQRILRFNVINGGVGPAKIESFEVVWKGKAYRSGVDLMRACCGLAPHGGAIPPSDPRHTALLTGQVQGIVLRSGELESFIILPLGDDNAALWNALNTIRPQLYFRLCYCSVLDECWRTPLAPEFSSGGQLHPEQVKSCPVPKVAYLQ